MTMTDPDSAADARLRKLRMRAWRRGTKEMDLILGPWADAYLATLDPATLDAFEALLEENDQDLYLWATGHGHAPDPVVPLLARIADHARDRLTPKC